MATDLTIPDPNSTLGKCSRCGAEIKMDENWYSFMARIVAILRGI